MVYRLFDKNEKIQTFNSENFQLKIKFNLFVIGIIKNV